MPRRRCCSRADPTGAASMIRILKRHWPVNELDYAKTEDGRQTVLAFTATSQGSVEAPLGDLRRWTRRVSRSFGLRYASRAQRDICGVSTRERERSHAPFLAPHSAASSSDACRCRRAVHRRSGKAEIAATHTSERPSIFYREPRGRLARPSRAHALLAGWCGAHSCSLFRNGMGRRPGVANRSTGTCRRATDDSEPSTHMMPLNPSAAANLSTSLCCYADSQRCEVAGRNR